MIVWTEDIIWQDEGFLAQLTAQHFTPSFWMARPNTHELSGGRGGSWRFQFAGEELVLHQYLRGGLVAHMLHNQYLWTGLKESRPHQELEVVKHALNAGLPVAPMRAYRLQRHGLFYRATSISTFLPHQDSLAAWLRQQALDAEGWQQLGSLIRRMHQCGINHADLNANNILLVDSQQPYLIDFDKAKIHHQQGEWREHNLQRLLRSLHKLKGQSQQQGLSFYFAEEDWDHLRQAYAR